MTFKNYIIEKLNTRSKKAVLFIDGTDKRARQAAMLHKSDDVIKPFLLLEKRDASLESKVPTIVIEDWKEKEEVLTTLFIERRKGKATLEDAKKAVFEPLTFAMLMLELGEVDGVIGGLVNPTSDILRAGFRVVGPKPGIKTISSVMIMERADEWYIFGDISVNIVPSIDQLVDIAHNASVFARSIDFKTKLAFLSFSTSGSAQHQQSVDVRTATVQYNEKYKPEYTAIGEVQFDAAFSPEIRKSKYKDEGFTKNPTVFIFPSLNAGNIGYKIAQRMGGFGAIGPIITGINKPVSDLSRGSTSMDVYNTALITAIQAEDK